MLSARGGTRSDEHQCQGGPARAKAHEGEYAARTTRSAAARIAALLRGFRRPGPTLGL